MDLATLPALAVVVIRPGKPAWASRITRHFATTHDLPGLQIEFGGSVRIAEGTSAGRRILARCLKRLHPRPLETRPAHIRAKARNFFWVEFPNLKQDPSPHIQTAPIEGA
jgi:hypothetical protein